MSARRNVGFTADDSARDPWSTAHLEGEPTCGCARCELDRTRERDRAFLARMLTRGNSQ